MKSAKMLTILVVALGLILCWVGVSEAAEPMGTAFTYQGHLYDANYVANGEYDFQFTLYKYKMPIGYTQVGNDVNKPDVDVIDGYFTVELDFNSPEAFTGDAHWLEIGVRPGELEDSNVYTPLSPWQEITPTPYALHSKNADTLDWSDSSAFASSSHNHDGLYYTESELNTSGAGGQVHWENLTEVPAGFADGTDDIGGPDSDWTISDSNMYSAVSGNVGIGETNPSEKLEVNGNININYDSVYKIAGHTVLSRTGADNIFVGDEAGENNIGGVENSAMGVNALYNNTTGRKNSAMGCAALLSNTMGIENVAMGHTALFFNTTGSENSAMGYHALQFNTTGNKNSAVGAFAGYLNSAGSSNVFLGYRAGLDETGSNKLYIANSDANTIIYGDFDTGNVGIGTTDPCGTLDVNGPIYQRGGVLHADYVFESDYELESLDEHSKFMWQNKHLPAIPETSVDEAGQEIIEVGAHRRGIVEELEKAHIYIEQLHKQNKALEKRVAVLEEMISQQQFVSTKEVYNETD